MSVSPLPPVQQRVAPVRRIKQGPAHALAFRAISVFRVILESAALSIKTNFYLYAYVFLITRFHDPIFDVPWHKPSTQKKALN